MSRYPADRVDPDCYLQPGSDLTVFFSDLDANDHINNVAMGRFFEQGRLERHRAVGVQHFLGDGHGFLVVSITISYLAQARWGRPVHVRTRALAPGRSSMVEEQGAWQDGVCVALADLTTVHTIDDVAAPIPDDMRDVLLQLVP